MKSNNSWSIKSLLHNLHKHFQSQLEMGSNSNDNEGGNGEIFFAIKGIDSYILGHIFVKLKNFQAKLTLLLHTTTYNLNNIFHSIFLLLFLIFCFYFLQVFIPRNSTPIYGNNKKNETICVLNLKNRKYLITISPCFFFLCLLSCSSCVIMALF